MSDLLQQAIAAIKAGDKNSGKRLLAQVLQQEPNNVNAWLWMSGVVETDAQRSDCLKQVLRIEPNHAHAAAGLARLNQAAPQPPEPEPTVKPNEAFSFDVEEQQADASFPSSAAFRFDKEEQGDDFSSIFGSDELEASPDAGDFFSSSQDEPGSTFGTEKAPFEEVEAEDFLAGLAFSGETEAALPDWGQGLYDGEAEGFGLYEPESAARPSYLDDSTDETLPPALADPIPFPEDVPPPKQRRARSLAWYQIWMSVLGSPTEKSFRFVLSDAKLSMDRGLIWMFCAALLQQIVIVGILYFIYLPMFGNLAAQTGIPIDASQVMRQAGWYVLLLIPISASAYTLFFALQSGLTHLVAKLFLGEGSYEQLVFATAAFQAPLLIISLVAVFIPYLNFCLGPLLGIYSLLLMINSIKAVYRLGTGGALGVIFVPGIVIFLLCCLIGFVFQSAIPVANADAVMELVGSLAIALHRH